MNNFVKNFLRKIRSSPVIIIFGIFCVILGFFVVTHRQKPISPDKLLSCFATSNGGSKADTYCIDRVVEELMHVYSTRDLLAYIATPSWISTAYGHLIAHFIGRQTFLKIGSIETALDQCTPGPDYGYGCIHGVIGAAIVKELGVSPTEADNLVHADPTTIERLAKKYCASTDYQLCHAVGHILFQISSDYTKTLATCDHASKDDIKREACARGAFMEGAGPQFSLSPNERPVTFNPTYNGFCDQISSAYQHACFWYLPRIQVVIFEKMGINNAAERLAISKDTCRKFTGAPHADCIESIGLNARGIFRDSDRPDRKYFCDQFDDGVDTQACILGVLGSFFNPFDFNGAANYCHDMVDPTIQNFCYHVLFRIAEQFSMGSAMATICDEKSTSKKCNQELKEYLGIKSTLPNYIFGLYGDRR